MSTEKERETHVYIAKLAEQAERYEGIRYFHISIIDSQLILMVQCFGICVSCMYVCGMDGRCSFAGMVIRVDLPLILSI